jgi:hypothetical protein
MRYNFSIKRICSKRKHFAIGGSICEGAKFIARQVRRNKFSHSSVTLLFYLYKDNDFLITIPIYRKIMALNDIRSLHSLNGNEPTPNREQRVLAHFAEVRRRKTIGQWQTLDSLAKRLCACH